MAIISKDVIELIVCSLASGGSLVGKKEELAAKVTFFTSQAYAESTKKSYSTHLKKYLLFCHHMNYSPVPAGQEQVELYIAYLSESLQYASVTKYLNIVRLLHVEAGLANPLNNFTILFHVSKVSVTISQKR